MNTNEDFLLVFYGSNVLPTFMDQYLNQGVILFVVVIIEANKYSELT